MAEDLKGIDLLDVLLIVKRFLDGYWFEVLFFFGLYDAIAAPDRAELAASKRFLAIDYVVPVSFVLAHSYYKEDGIIRSPLARLSTKSAPNWRVFLVIEE